MMRPLLLGVSVAAAACGGRADQPPTNDTAGAAPSAPGTPGATAAAPSAWPAAMGGLLVVGSPAGAARSGILLVPDSITEVEPLATARGARVELFGASGRVGEATVVAVEQADSAECVAWPMARLQVVADSVSGAAPSARPWTVALRVGAAMPLVGAELGAVGARDSTRLVVELARLASGLPGDTIAAFRGLPMIVRSAVRVRGVGDREVVVAEIVRRVGQEATPLEERIAVIAERDSAATTPFRAAWVGRVAGVEETIEATELVGAVLVGGEPVFVLQRESARGARYELLVRTARGWEARWASPWSGC